MNLVDISASSISIFCTLMLLHFILLQCILCAFKFNEIRQP